MRSVMASILEEGKNYQNCHQNLNGGPVNASQTVTVLLSTCSHINALQRCVNTEQIKMNHSINS
jgi:hypothetical protein